MNKFCKFFFAAAYMALSFTSCSSDDGAKPEDPEAGSEFAIWTQLGSWPNTSYYILGVNNLNEGAVKLEGNGIDVTTKLNNSVITRGGYYYFYNTAEGRFGKYQLVNGAVSTIREVPLTNLASLAGHTWIDDNTLVIIGANAAASAINYSIIKVNDLDITNGTVSGLPDRPDGYKYRVGGDIQYKDGKLFFSIAYQNTSDYQLYPRFNTLAVSYPAFSVTRVSTDTRTAGVGNTSGYFATSFVDEKGDMYFLTSWNGVWKDDGTSSPKNIYRIKAGSDELDASYLLDVQAELGHEAAAGLFMNLGNGKAIIKYQEAPGNSNTKFGYAILNLTTGKELRKLTEIPSGASGERNVYVENGKAYIAVLSGQGTDYIWIYDSNTDKVTKGLQIQGGYTSFSRIDKLQ